MWPIASDNNTGRASWLRFFRNSWFGLPLASGVAVGFPPQLSQTGPFKASSQLGFRSQIPWTARYDASSIAETAGKL